MSRWADVLPPLEPDLRANLERSIKEHGVINDVIEDLDTGEIIDGHHRKQIAEELGTDYPVNRMRFKDDAERLAYVLDVNLARRNLTREQRDEVIRKAKAMGLSTREIGEKVGVSNATVSRTPTDTVTNVTPSVKRQAREERNQKVRELAEQRLSQAEIGRRLSIPQSTVSDILQSRRKDASEPKRKSGPKPGTIQRELDAPWNLNSQRDRVQAESHRRDLIAGLSHMKGTLDALKLTDFGKIAAVATEQEAAIWRKQITALRSELQVLAHRMEQTLNGKDS